MSLHFNIPPLFEICLACNSFFPRRDAKPGLHLGYTLSFLKDSNWILALNAKYNWFATDAVGPITVEGDITSVYKAQRVGLSSLNLGMVAGVKF